MARPVIAITGPSRGARAPRALVAFMIRYYGGTPLHLRPGDENRALAYDGVVVTGGHDIEPVLYAAEPEVEPRYDPARDAFESAIIRDAMARGIPLLGICRGAQLLNVCRGGSLFQDLRTRRDKTSHRRTILPLKQLRILDSDASSPSLLRRTVGVDAMRINSLHNQGIDRLGDGLQIVGRDLDGIVQAIEDPSQQFLLGVQWHPEYLIYAARQRALFHELVRCVAQIERIGSA